MPSPTIATNPQTLMASVTCLECGADAYILELYKLALLKEILLVASPTAMTDPNSLMAQAACFACLPPGQLQILEVALLAQLVQLEQSGGGGGGGQLVLYTTSDPTTDGVTPTDLNSNALAYKANGAGPIFVWDPAGHAWH